MKIVKKLHNTVAVDAIQHLVHEGKPLLFIRYKHLVHELGKPSLFITYTLDVTCKEVKDNLAPGQSPYDRPELLNKVFEIKKKELIREIVVDGIFAHGWRSFRNEEPHSVTCCYGSSGVFRAISRLHSQQTPALMIDVLP